MLVLTRKIGEKVVIGEDIVLRVVEIQGNRVQIGIDAPAFVQILREELVGPKEELNVLTLEKRPLRRKNHKPSLILRH